MRQILLVAAAILTFASALGADPATDRAEVLKVTQRLFDILSDRDPEVWKTVLLEEGYMLSLMPNRDAANSGPMRRRLTPTRQVLKTLAPVEQEYVERWVGDPTVLIRKDMAQVWGAFDFHIDGTFSHCGINSISLVRTEEGWRVSSVMWTNTYTQADCPTGDGQG